MEDWSDAVLEAPAFVAGLDDVAVMGDLRKEETSGGAGWNALPRGKSFPAQKPESRRRQCRAWRDDGSRASRGLRNAQRIRPASNCSA